MIAADCRRQFLKSGLIYAARAAFSPIVNHDAGKTGSCTGKGASMTILLFGGTGMLGQAIAAEGARRGRRVIAVSRRGPDRRIDLATADSLRDLFARPRPSLVINAAALTRLDACE